VRGKTKINQPIWREMTMAIEKKSLGSKKAANPAPVNKKSSAKAKLDTAKPASGKVIAAMKMPGI
jgi:hypothetical protein